MAPVASDPQPFSLRERAGGYLRQIPAWVRLRRLQHEGFLSAYYRYQIWARILESAPVVTEAVHAGAPVEVHILCYDRDYLTALWSLKSFYYHAGVRYPLVIHLQNRLSRLALARLRHHFPAARVVTRDEADPVVNGWLAGRGLNRLLDLRRRAGFMLKLIDFPVLSEAVNLLTLDSDILFYRRPDELLQAGPTPYRGTLFQRDLNSAYNMTEERIREEVGVAIAPRVNTGMMLFAREGLNLARCDEFLAHPELARPSGFIEQTLYALCASDQGTVQYLPETYRVSEDRHLNPAELVAWHFAGQTRPLLTDVGIPALIRRGFLEAVGRLERPVRFEPTMVE